MKINVDKTHAVWLGCKANSSEHLCKDLNLSWVNRFTLLGIEFDSNLNITVLLNYEKKIYEIEKIFVQYKKYNLTLIGKVTVIRTLAIPKMVYLLTCLPSPDKNTLKRLT